MEIQPNFQNSCLRRSQVPNNGEREFKFLFYDCSGHPSSLLHHLRRPVSPSNGPDSPYPGLPRPVGSITYVLIRRPRCPPSSLFFASGDVGRGFNPSNVPGMSKPPSLSRSIERPRSPSPLPDSARLISNLVLGSSHCSLGFAPCNGDRGFKISNGPYMSSPLYL